MALLEEAIKALESMPVGSLKHEQEDADDPRKIETIKCATSSSRKLGHASHCVTGNGGVAEAIPHVIFTEASIDEPDSISHMERTLAFKKSAASKALNNANVALASTHQGMLNSNNKAKVGPGVEFKTFHDFTVECCHLCGHTEDRHDQREGIKFLCKPPAVRVQQWQNTLNDKNDLIPHLVGNGNVCNEDEMRRNFFKTMPHKWQEEFTSNGNNDISTTPLSVIVSFMKQQEAKARAKAAANKAKPVCCDRQVNLWRQTFFGETMG